MIDEDERQRLRKKRSRARKRKRIRKKILLIIAFIIIILAVFAVTIKLVNPEFSLASLFPGGKAQQAVQYVDEKLFKNTTKEETTTAAVTTAKGAKKQAKDKLYDYAEFSEFEFDTSKQGNQIGNLLNKTSGAVTYSSSYIYYSIAGEGIFRFEPNEEKNGKVKTGDYNYKCLNVLGDYLYALDVGSNVLEKMPVYGGDSVTVAKDIAFAYLYNDKIYYTGTDNTVGYISTEDFAKTVLYTAPADKSVKFAGISLSRVFFTAYDSVADYYEYITVSLTDANDRLYFRDDTSGDDVTNMSMESGFMYYYQKQADGSYNLCRQKFGSEQVVTLLESATVADYPVVYNNRLYYSELDGSRFKARELNMNTMDKKTMLGVSDCDGTGTLAVGYGYQYVFLIGSKTASGDELCRASCIYTSSSSDNTLKFKGGKLKY